MSRLKESAATVLYLLQQLADTAHVSILASNPRDEFATNTSRGGER